MYFKVKRLLICILCLYSSFLCAQEQDKTLIFGKILTSDNNFDSLSYRVRYVIYLPNKKAIFGFCALDSLGQYSKLFPHEAIISLYPSFSKFYGDTISLKTEKKEKIEQNLHIRKQTYLYTEEKAIEDIKNGIVNLIIFDSTRYELNKKYNYTKSFKFDYKILKNPNDEDKKFGIIADREFGTQVHYYNNLVEAHIDSILNKKTWQREIAFIEDSLIHLELDDYMSKNPIDIDDLTIPPQEFLPNKMLKKIKAQTLEFERLYEDDKSVLSYTPQFMLDKIDSITDNIFLWDAHYLIVFHYERMMKELIMRITNQKYIGLTNTMDLIIPERNEVGDLQFQGHGYVVDDDLFTIAGRANYLLRTVTGEKLGYVSMYSTPSYLKRLQNRWIHWLWQLNKK